MTAPVRRARVIRVFQDFAHTEAAGGILLLICTAIALAWANSPWREAYVQLWHTPVSIRVGTFAVAKDLQHWINDGLMAVFFFVVGLEIKREVLVGELTTMRRAALPAAAALGGMIVPAVIFAAINLGGPGSAGWGIPMATDIAFALGVLALLGDRVPLPLKVFLTALAIVDDLGAVLVIAVFYSSGIVMGMLAAGVGMFVIMLVANRAGLRHPGVYGLLGLIMWVAFLKSGVHATIAGVLAALAIPASARIDAGAFRERARELLQGFPAAGGTAMLSSQQQEAVYGLTGLMDDVATPLQRLEHDLHPWVSFLIMPVFALANAGIVLDGSVSAAVAHPVTLGIVAGLVLGKLVGIAGLAWLATRIGLAELPPGVTWRHILGAAALGGIGFTMSLFIGQLAFGESEMLTNAKLGILLASVVAGGAGWMILAPSRQPAEPDGLSV